MFYPIFSIRGGEGGGGRGRGVGFLHISILRPYYLGSSSLKAKCIFVKCIRTLYELINFNSTEFVCFNLKLLHFVSVN